MERPQQDQYRLLRDISLQQGTLRLWIPLTDMSVRQSSLARRADLLRSLLLPLDGDRIDKKKSADMSNSVNDL